MLLSIIIPFYKGNNHINQTLKSVKRSITYALEKEIKEDEFEIIIINDSPEVSVIVEDISNVKIYKNNKNVGIHTSRIIGMKKARGKYVMFLDQDDLITECAISEMLYSIGENDVVIGNGFVENKIGSFSHFTFSNKFFGRLATYLYPYILLGNQITSPGQTIIRKSSVPIEYEQIYLKNNGADDELLWILLLLKKRSLKYIDVVTYRHCNTGENASDNAENMFLSNCEYITYLINNNIINGYKKRMLLFRVNLYRCMLDKDKKELLYIVLKNVDVFFQWFGGKIIRRFFRG